MTRRSAWLVGAALAWAALVTPTVWAQGLDPAKIAEKAVDAGDPSKVDPNLIKGEDWTFDFQFDHPEPIVVTTPGGEREVYWYVVYTVTNRTALEHNYVPTFTLFGDTTGLRRAGIFPTVFEAIKKNRKIPFLENAVKMIGKVLPGEDNARTGVAIFAPLDRETNRFTIFVEGLSGQYIERSKTDAPAAEAKPAAADAKPEAKAEAKPTAKPDEATITRLRKTLAIEYKLPGDKWWKNLDQPLFVSKTWTWR